jgi:hypothetical protein
MPLAQFRVYPNHSSYSKSPCLAHMALEPENNLQIIRHFNYLSLL